MSTSSVINVFVWCVLATVVAGEEGRHSSTAKLLDNSDEVRRKTQIQSESEFPRRYSHRNVSDEDEVRNIKGTPDSKNKLTFIDCRLVKTNGATFIFLRKLGNTFFRGSFWPFLSFTSLAVSSLLKHGPKS